MGSRFLSFGLFGDGLLDPYVIERAQLMKQKLSKVILHVNTNGAAYSHNKHLPLFDLVDVLALCVFRAKVATDSGRTLPSIPAEGCH